VIAVIVTNVGEQITMDDTQLSEGEPMDIDKDLDEK